MRALAATVIPAITIKPVKGKAISFTPDFKPYIIAGAVIAGLLLANTVVVQVWQTITCNC